MEEGKASKQKKWVGGLRVKKSSEFCLVSSLSLLPSSRPPSLLFFHIVFTLNYIWGYTIFFSKFRACKLFNVILCFISDAS